MHDFVTLHYRLTWEDQGVSHVIYDTFATTPVSFMLGQGFLHEQIEAILSTMQDGEEKSQSLGKIFGEFNPDLCKTFDKETLARYGVDENFTVGEYVRFSIDKPITASFLGYTSNGDAQFDFNHPLAGKALHLDVKMIAKLS